MDITVREIAAPMLEGKRGAEFNKEYNRVHHILGQYTLGLARKHYDTAKAAQGIIDAEHKDVVAALRAENARLRDELAKYTEPLTDEQAARVVLGEYRATMNDWDRDKPALELAWDAAIRRVRGES